jgi:hypothetical protein
VILDSLLGPKAAELDLTLRCEIMFPEGDVTTLAFREIGSEFTLSRFEVNRSPGSVGVGGVLTITGAGDDSLLGGVCGVACVSIGWSFEFRGLSGDELAESGCCPCLSNILDTTLARLLLPKLSLDVAAGPLLPILRSGLLLGLAPLRGFNASFNLPTGDGDRFCELSVGARSLLSGVRDTAESEATAALARWEELDSEVVPSSVSVCVISGTIDSLTRGDDEVRYPMWDWWVDNGGRVSRGLRGGVLERAKYSTNCA